MTTDKFRRQLREESQGWQQEGLIDINTYSTLAERYQFGELSNDSGNRFIGILLGLGGILLGLGAITFVAANWQDWSRVARTILLLVLFLGVNSTGFYLWHNPTRRRRLQRLGHGLLLTGGLILGANLGLMSQMFHQSGPLYQLFIVWGLGVLAMAYGLRLASLGVLAWILIMLSYWNYGIGNLNGTHEWEWFPQLMAYLPVLISLFFLPLAHWLRSRWLYGLWGVSFVLLFGTSDVLWQLGKGPGRGAFALASIIPPALLWSYRGIGNVRSSNPSKERFLPIGRSLAVFSIGSSLYVASFKWVWDHNIFATGMTQDFVNLWPGLISLGLYFTLVLLSWWRIAKTESLWTFRERWLQSGVFAVILLGMYGLAIAYSTGTSPIAGPIGVNILFFGLSLLLIHDGLLLSVRRRFWGGMILLVLGLMSRMFEYNTDLTLKAIVLCLCGLGIIAAGLWFEYRVKQPIQPALPER